MNGSRVGDVAAQPRWYAVSLRSRHEKKAHAELLRRGIERFLPLIGEVHLWSDRKKKVMVPLCRGYLFVRTDLILLWRKSESNLRTVPGV